jgi:hypothetical protein
MSLLFNINIVKAYSPLNNFIKFAFNNFTIQAEIKAPSTSLSL